MADFRKLLLALIAGALMFGTVAGAADFSCQMSANPTLVRSEAVADFVGDVLLSCSGSIPQLGASDAVVANIRLTLAPGAIVTSKVLETARKISEATLVLDGAGWVDNGGWQRHPKGYLNSGSTMPTPWQDGTQNIYQAIQISDTELEWQGVVLIGPGSQQAAGGSLTRSILLTNVRVNAQGLGNGAPIYAQVNVTSPTAFPVFGNSSLLLANIRQGLTVAHSGNSIKNCDLLPNGSISFTTTFTEGVGGGSFGTSFKPRLNGRTNAAQHFAPATGFFDESGYNPTGFSGGGGVVNGGVLDVGSALVAQTSIGLATQGTQFGITLTNIPSGLTFANADVAITATNGMTVVSNSTTTTSSGATVNIILEVTGFTLVGASYPAETNQDVVTVVVTGRYTAPPVVGAATAHGRFLPNSSYSTAQTESVAPVPRFVDSSIVPDAIVIRIDQSCKTLLLFPYLTSSAGYNSGIAITNSSVDPLGETIVTGEIGFPTYPVTKPQAGACTLWFYGQSNLTALTSAQHKQTIIAVPAGGQFITNLAVGAKGFVYAQSGSKTAACDTAVTGNTCPDMPAYAGYMIAVCNFQWGHGFAFVTDTGSDRTMGYLALVIPDRGATGGLGGRLPQDKSLGNVANQGEQLSF